GYKKGTKVTLTAEPEDSWMFVNWIQDGVSKDGNSIEIVMDTSRAIEAVFARKPSSDGNMVLNGDFSSETDNWTLNVWDGEASGAVVDDEYNLSIGSASEESYGIQLIQPGLFLEKGKMYLVSFDAYAKSERTLEVNVEMHDDPWTSYLTEASEFNLTSTKKNFNFVFTMNEATDVNGRISFNAGKSISGLCIDNVKVVEKSLGTYKKPLIRENSRSLKAICSKSVLRVEFTNSANSQAFMELFDMKGNVVKQATFKTRPNMTNVYECKLSGMANGMYIVKLKCGQNVNRTNVMVVR
ncbi:MAG: carbohydrate binding domain-containing protein, partial [Fibrobacter sp.]|nr:carbohydrate binding domain-containing protein [Fibrobacter sp.]